MVKEAVLFICSFNSARSRIAEGLLASRCGNRYAVYSAGIAPVLVNPNAAAVMHEIGIDITNHGSTSVAAIRHVKFNYVVTLCDHVLKSNIPLPDGGIRFHRNFITPCEIRENRDEVLADFRKLRDRIDAYLTEIFPDNSSLGETAPIGDRAYGMVDPTRISPRMRISGGRT
jgi:arsenate reductase